MERLRTLVQVFGLDTLVVLVAVISVGRIWTQASGSPWAAAGLALLATVPLLARRRLPLAAPLLALASLLGLSVLIPGAAWEQLQLFLGALLCFWVIGSENGRRRALAGLAAGLAVAVATVATDAGHRRVSDYIFGVAITLAAWGAGMLLGSRARVAAAAQRRAEQAVLEQEFRAREAAAQERARIARELHDVIAHTVSVMVVQAGAAEEVLEGENAAARAALAAIRDSGKGALEELRRLLGFLREAGGATATARASLDQLSELIAETEDLGLQVEFRESGRPRALPPGMDQAAYRIIQEALTNAIKHAGAACVTVALTWEPDAVGLAITDDGRGVSGTPGAAGGHGLLGMHERALLYGGNLETGNQPGGGYMVRVRLPL
ncbi:MAG: histidine kinase [Streptosporangiaceae bacterium]